MNKVRTRFAPSPTGPLHIGGLRTALFNYLFAKKNGGTFVLRIEDTDQLRKVEESEKYILDTLAWCNIEADESVEKEGEYAPYRQSERQKHYKKYVKYLIDKGDAYYAFDTPEDLNKMRENLLKKMIDPKYDLITRTTMKNSITLSTEEVNKRLDSKEPYVIRFKTPQGKTVRFYDEIRGWVTVQSESLDDKVLVKSDGFPTYHLANVVDDHMMAITHVIRGEEWLPSAPLHILLHQALGWEEIMPKFAHLPLILKPNGQGKLSKRDAEKQGFPVFPLRWKDPETQEISEGYREQGFMPDALLNFLALLGWNPGTDKELFTLKELEEAFSMENINRSATKFDYQKALWFNQQYVKRADSSVLTQRLAKDLKEKFQIDLHEDTASKIVALLKERVTFEYQITEESLSFFHLPKYYDPKVLKKKTEEAEQLLMLFSDTIQDKKTLDENEIKELFTDVGTLLGLSSNKYMQMLRVSLTGLSSGPDLMQTIAILGNKETSKRIKHFLRENKTI